MREVSPRGVWTWKVLPYSTRGAVPIYSFGEYSMIDYLLRPCLLHIVSQGVE